MNMSVSHHAIPGLVLGLALALVACPALGDEGGAPPTFHALDPQLAGLIETLLERNPRIRAARADARSVHERAAQQSSLPDPRVTYSYFAESPETRVGPQRHALELSQAVPWGGKRKQQSVRAAHEAAGAEWRAHDLERALVVELKGSYFEAAFVQEALAVNADEILLLRRFERIALTRYSTGQGIQQAVIKVQTDISRLVDRETALRQRLDALSRLIARLIGTPDAAFVLEPVSLPLLAVEPDLERLEATTIRDHPRVMAAQETIRADEARMRRAELASRPDFRFGVRWIEVGDREDPAGVLSPPQDNGQDVWALSVGIDVPLYRKRTRAAVAEAHESMSSSTHMLQDTRDRLRYAIQEVVLRLESVQERALLYRDVIIPQAEQSLGSAEAAYTTDRQSFLDLLDAERVLFQVRLTYHRLVADHWIALADLERGLGRAYPEEGSNR